MFESFLASGIVSSLSRAVIAKFLYSGSSFSNLMFPLLLLLFKELGKKIFSIERR